MAVWDLTALINAADPRATLAERHLWLARLMEWLRHAPTRNLATEPARAPPPADAVLPPAVAAEPAKARTPSPVVRLRHVLNRLDKDEALRGRVQGMLAGFWRDIDAPALLADFGFGARQTLASEVRRRVLQRVLPGTPETADLAALFTLLFEPGDEAWIEALDDATLERVAALLAPGDGAWRVLLLDAITILVSAIHSAGYTPALRQRMDPALRKTQPFRLLTRAADDLRSAMLEDRHDDALRAAAWLRTLLDACREAAGSVSAHLERYGVSVDIVYEVDQLQARCERTALLLDCVLAPHPLREGQRLLATLVRVLRETTGLRALMARQYALLARQVAERSAEVGEHYITRSRDEYRQMFRRAAGGGAVIAGTTFAKFAIGALGLTAFWTGFWSGANYAASFVIVMLLHFTVATKQPAMTAPAMAARLPAGGESASMEAIEGFVDRVAALIRSQAAAVAGNLALCFPIVLAVQIASAQVFGATPVDADEARHVLQSLTLLGPTLLFAAFTGVLLFASSLVAGWAENFFVLHRLDSAIAWNPRIVARLGAARARRWAGWWRRNISGVAANVSLGMMLGLVPAVAGFFGLGLEVRHVTLSAGQLAAALGALGLPALQEPAFWWCALATLFTGVLNVTVSFYLAFKVALRSRGVRLTERSRIAAALRRRLRTDAMSFLMPPRREGG
jgi:site-specific recombinase